MKLSEVLDLYSIIPLNQSVIVDSHVNEDMDDNDVNPITISWTDPDTMDRYIQVFDEQEIDVLQVPLGHFNVETAEGEIVQFIALTGANLPTLI